MNVRIETTAERGWFRVDRVSCSDCSANLRHFYAGDLLLRVDDPASGKILYNAPSSDPDCLPVRGSGS